MTKPNLAIINIDSWAGQCADAVHVYGKLILCSKSEVTLENVEDWNLNHLGETLEIRRPLTPALAKALDDIDGGNFNRKSLNLSLTDPSFAQDNPDCGTTSRFDTIAQVVEAGIKKWEELGRPCPLISLYQGERYSFSGKEVSESCETINLLP